ncbi:chondrosarcoma-associated gene 2/3 protein isoform X1 [Trachypithecus francoisi]|uniref:chondrosarcoma-associated gene 2/3 protein isoform X1 n=1 Tax=Trachypithecus francoisi TaxID=54180 RepID=UPI00141AA2D4|nr:chondrosarcoma-associated gene 2/3 protein isoform X1 [Trachypithecus francoisi]
MWMGLIQLVEGVKRKYQAFREKEFYHKTNIKMWCEFLACWPAFTVLEEAWGDQVDWSRLLRDAGVVNMSRKPRASSPLSNNHPPTPKRRGRGKHPLNPGPEALSKFPRQPGREKGPAKEVPGTKASP